MRILKFISIAIFIISAGSAIFAQRPPVGYRISHRKFQLIVTYQGKPHILKTTSDHIDAALVTDTKLLFANRSGGFTYLLADVTGQSKVRQDSRQCGAGEESNLIWIKLKPDWTIADIKSIRYESCWQPTTSEDGYKIKDNKLSLAISDFHRDVDALISYNANEPDKGLIVKEFFVNKQ